jgi:hypothetical protein
MSPASTRLMPNFSHGTAGVAYALATLYKVTRETRFLDAALGRRAPPAGDCEDRRRHLPRAARSGRQSRSIYLGWCHGPPARRASSISCTSRPATRVDDVGRPGRPTASSRAAFPSSARAASGTTSASAAATPASRSSSSTCTASRRIALSRLRRALTADLTRARTGDSRGTRWTQAEDRLKPDDRTAQTGYMQGAAGIGLWFLHLDGSQRARAPFVRFPIPPGPSERQPRALNASRVERAAKCERNEASPSERPEGTAA